MPDNVITFPEPAGLFSKRRTIPVTSKSHKNVRNGPNMHTLLFRSYDLIVQSDEAELVRDVCFDIDKAQTKLKASDDACKACRNGQPPRCSCSPLRTPS
jgi:hypothetical protein